MLDYDEDTDFGPEFPDEPSPFAFCDGYTIHDPHAYRAINGNTYRCPGFDKEDDEALREREAQPPCPHGLSQWLCADPVNHYPSDM